MRSLGATVPWRPRAEEEMATGTPSAAAALAAFLRKTRRVTLERFAMTNPLPTSKDMPISTDVIPSNARDFLFVYRAILR
jgi:hypothetical protein